MGFSAKSLESDASMSPTSILETKPFSAIANPFFAEKSHRKPFCGNGDLKAIGLGIVDALTKEKSEKKASNSSSRMVLFGSQLKIQIPTEQPNSPSPPEFGVKNKNSLLSMHSPAGEVRNSSPRLFTGCLSPREMELSEDYTCVISHGPNPKKTHIFDNCIVESCGGDGFLCSKKESRFLEDQNSSFYASEGFLSFCHACGKSLAQGKDIFMYRGEQAFCSHECREREMVSEEEETASYSEDFVDDF